MTLAANEIRRRTYLQALGIDQYVSRRNLPGAAPTRRLIIQSAQPKTAPLAAGAAPIVPATEPPLQAPSGMLREALNQTGDAKPESSSPMAAETAPRAEQTVEQFSVAVLRSGGWLWLQDLAGLPLAREQVQLVAAMGKALAPGANVETLPQFDWPMHQNQQLDLGTEAAAMTLNTFLARHLTDTCQGLVLLGEQTVSRLGGLAPESARCLILPATRDLLATPGLKQQAWRLLKPHAQH